MYLIENCNLTIAAEKLYLHRNTLTYRIKKIEQLLNCNLHNFEDCLKIKMALYITEDIVNNDKFLVKIDKNIIAIGHRK